MIAIVTILLAFPLGYFVRSRLAANTTYAIAYLWAFTFQTWYLTFMEVSGDAGAGYGDGGWAGILPYGGFTLAIFGVGFALVAAGQWARARRATRREIQRAAA